MMRRVRFGVEFTAVLVALATGGCATLLPRRETVTIGWGVHALLVFVDDLLVYQLVGGQPTISEYEQVRNPLGPLQAWGGMVQ